MSPDSPILKWLERWVVEPIILAKWFPSPSGWRVFGVQLGFYENNWEDEFTLVRVEGPGLGRKLWKNALLSFYLHLPFCVSLHLKIPVAYAGERWGWALQTLLGWKPEGRLSATFRIQPDLVDDFNTPTQHWRARGLKEGWV